jgi:hypothetical protein
MKKVLILASVVFAIAACSKGHVCPTYNNGGSNNLQHHSNGEHKPKH